MLQHQQVVQLSGKEGQEGQQQQRVWLLLWVTVGLAQGEWQEGGQGAIRPGRALPQAMAKGSSSNSSRRSWSKKVLAQASAYGGQLTE
jgi:hypothetical protein